MNFETLDIQQYDRGVVTVALNRPDKRNAMSAQMISELTQVAQTIGANTETRAIVLSGHGKIFCSGADLAWMKTQIESDRKARMKEARKLAMMLKALNEMPTPLIACLHGGVFAGAIGLACVCDIAIAETQTRFSFTETRIGLIPATISPYVVARMGEGYARRVFMSAKVFDANEAAALGLIARSVPSEKLAEEVEKEVAPYLHTAPGAVGHAKALVRSLGLKIDANQIDASIEKLVDVWEQEEAAKGIEAFLTKTNPWWIPADKN